uniref:GAG-pre-integrase domain-containing protein n=1 Tax=Noccaea caerulescens TaxID=107243 RepID=A0A1J3K6E2_NOCCA
MDWFSLKLINLFSVSKLCEDYPRGVLFDVKQVFIIDLETEKVVAKSPRREELYVLENHEFVAYYSNRQGGATEDVWYHRLGHSNSQILHQ